MFWNLSVNGTPFRRIRKEEDVCDNLPGGFLVSLRNSKSRRDEWDEISVQKSYDSIEKAIFRKRPSATFEIKEGVRIQSLNTYSWGLSFGEEELVEEINAWLDAHIGHGQTIITRKDLDRVLPVKRVEKAQRPIDSTKGQITHGIGNVKGKACHFCEKEISRDQGKRKAVWIEGKRITVWIHVSCDTKGTASKDGKPWEHMASPKKKNTTKKTRKKSVNKSNGNSKRTTKLHKKVSRGTKKVHKKRS